MDANEYRSALIQMAVAAKTIKDMGELVDIPAWIAANNLVSAMGPFSDPTGWRQLEDEIPNRIAVARGLQDFLTVCRKYPIALTAEALAARFAVAADTPITGPEGFTAGDLFGEKRGDDLDGFADSPERKALAGELGDLVEPDVCRACNGKGSLKGGAGGKRICDVCEGSGRVGRVTKRELEPKE